MLACEKWFWRYEMMKRIIETSIITSLMTCRDANYSVGNEPVNG